MKHNQIPGIPFEDIFGEPNPLRSLKELQQKAIANPGRSKWQDLYIKTRLISDAETIIPVYAGDGGAGAILLMPGHKWFRPVQFPGHMIIIHKDAGESEEESELMGKKMKVSYIQNDIIFVSAKAITTLRIGQHLCKNPDCESCNKERDRGDEPWYNVDIEFVGGQIPGIEIPTFSAAFEVVKQINEWREKTK